MHATPQPLSLKQVLFCGAMIVTLSMGIRHGFGLWLQPITQEQGWSRQSFSLAIAIQNLSWGVIGVFAGMLADKLGAFRVLVAGAVLYAIGLAGMALSPTPLMFALTAGVLIGAAQAGTTYAVIYGVIGRQISVERRSWAMGVAAAAGSFGQFLMVPVEGRLIGGLGWQTALLVLAAMVLMIVPLAFGLREPRHGASPLAHRDQTIAQATREALRYPSFVLLTAGYFVCGFQVVFIGVHLPTYLRDIGMTANVGSRALAIIAIGNIVGTYVWGMQGGKYPKRLLLSAIYLLRAVVIVAFLVAPKTEWVVYLFAAAMGSLWLSTVPLTNGLVASRYGVAYLSMLSGVVFFGHQIGSFAGVWMGGYLFDKTGTYFWAWVTAAALGVFAALVHLPIDEKPLARPAAA